MNDDLEDELIIQLITAHMKLVSRLPPQISALLETWAAPAAHLLRILRFFCCKPEIVLIGGLLFGAWLYLTLGGGGFEIWTASQLAAKLRHSVDGGAGKVIQLAKTDRVVPNDSFADNGKGFWQHRVDKVGFATYALKGRRPKMEDRVSVALADGQKNLNVYAVYDGHGGEFAADFARERLVPRIVSQLHKSRHFIDTQASKKIEANDVVESPGSKVEDVKATESDKENDNDHGKYVSGRDILYDKLISDEVLALDKELLEEARKQQSIAGTTALLAVENGPQFIVANVGDSRGIMVDRKGGVIPLSFDHKPQQLKERKRIEEAGGFITFNGVWRVVGVLATSRALGDLPLKQKPGTAVNWGLVTAQPDVLTFDLHERRPAFAILATDGLWDVFSNEEAASFVRDYLGAQEDVDGAARAAKCIVTAAYDRGSLDNISVIVVDFRRRTWAQS